MAIVDQDIGTKALTAENQLSALNREVVPVVRKLRKAVNERAGGYYAETFGDGVATVFAIQHDLGSRDVLAQFYDTSTLLEFATTALERTDVDTITATFGAPPAVNGARAVVRR